MTRGYQRRRTDEVTPYVRLLRQVAEAEGVTVKLTRSVLDRFIEKLPEAVWGLGRLVVPGLGSFRVRARKARRIAHPQEPQTVHLTLPATRVVACRVAGSWRRRG